MTGTRPVAILLFALLAAMASRVACARDDIGAMIDAIRKEGCGTKPGVETPLEHDAQLQRVARSLAEGMGLRDAMTDAGYRALRSSALEMAGSDAALERTLTREACADIVDPGFLEVGFERRDGGVWIVLAAPLNLPATGDADEIARRVLALVNEARAEARRCGRKRFDAALPLTASATLTEAAAAHARDMAERGELSHAGADGSSAGERAERAGYDWKEVAENIAAGQTTAEQVVAGWVKSPRHCSNLMGASYSEMGVAFAESNESPGIYWAQVFAAPRS